MAVYRTAADILVQYASTSENTVHAAIDSVDHLPEEQTSLVWESVTTWAASKTVAPKHGRDWRVI